LTLLVRSIHLHYHLETIHQRPSLCPDDAAITGDSENPAEQGGSNILKHPERTMKIRFLLALVGLAISFALPTLAQQTSTPDPELRQKIIALTKNLTTQ
jgi:hypothetical protein